MTPQTKRVRAHLKQHGTITPIQAFKQMGIYRLASRIHELRESGMVIINRKWKTARGKIRSKYMLEGRS